MLVVAAAVVAWLLAFGLSEFGFCELISNQTKTKQNSRSKGVIAPTRLQFLDAFGAP
jgi:hypothetical protein